MAKIRHYNMGDIEALTAMVMRSLPTLPNYENVKPNADRIRYLLTHNENSAQFMCLVLVDEENVVHGGIAGYNSPTLFSWDAVAKDVFLYIEDGEYRTKANVDALIKGYITWAKSRKAVSIYASQTSGFREKPLGELLKRQGFKEIGKLFVLE